MQEILHIRKVLPEIVVKGLKRFEGTALLTNHSWDNMVDKKIRDFYVDISPLAPDNLYPDFWEHQLLASIYSRRLAALVGLARVSPLKAQAMGFLHDLGRVVLPHRYFVNDVIWNLLAQEIGFRETFMEDLYPFDRILGFYNSVQGPADLTLPQMINHVSDGLGRRNSAGVLLGVADLTEVTYARKYGGGVWNTEDQALSLALDDKREDFEKQLRGKEIASFHYEFGIDFEALREKIWIEFQEDRNQKWIKACQEAHAG